MAQADGSRPSPQASHAFRQSKIRARPSLKTLDNSGDSVAAVFDSGVKQTLLSLAILFFTLLFIIQEAALMRARRTLWQGGP